VFAACSGQADLPSLEASEAPEEELDYRPIPIDQMASRTGVREGFPAPTTHPGHQDHLQGPAHPSNRLVAQLNESWRVIDDPLQWRLQRKKGNSREKNSGWVDRSYCTTREGLLRCIRECCGVVEPTALAKLNALSVHHAMQNLDVRGTYQFQLVWQSDPLISKGLRACGENDHPL
jgi:hypothetical protein